MTDRTDFGEKEGQPLLSNRLVANRPLTLPTLPSLEMLARTIGRVLDKYDAPQKLPDRDVERMFAEMMRRIRDNDWHKVSMKFVTGVASEAFEKVHRHREELAQIRTFLIEETKASDRGGFLNRMMRIYVASFEAGASHTAELAHALHVARARVGAQWQAVLASIPEFLDPQAAPAAIAALMDRVDQPWHDLRQKGLRQPHAPGLMDYAHLAFLNRIGPRLDQTRQIEKLLHWLRPDETSIRQTGVGRAIEALLRPWERHTPTKDVQALLIDRLTALYGHPRVNRQAAWNEVSPQLERIFLQWLMGADIRFLFKVLTEVERGHMWADREHFWWTLHEKGQIDEVWIAFHDDGYRAALRKLPQPNDRAVARFGRQIGERNKSLLIMRIGNKIVVEGTYNFKVHIFNMRQGAAPKLYQAHYDVSDIRGMKNAAAIQHLGNWQSKVSLALAQ